LPGYGQFGSGKICIRDHALKSEHDDVCRVPGGLVDGGVSGIFGRGLIEPRTSAEDGALPLGDGDGPQRVDRAARQGGLYTLVADPELVIVDAGRTLSVRYGRKVRYRLWAIAEWIWAFVMLRRWLQVALEVGYRDELKRVRDGQQSDGYKCRLVRLAEEEHKKHTDVATLDDVRQLELNRLTMLRDLVHSMSLLKANRGWANRAVTVAIAACALEFDEERHLEQILEDIGSRLTTEVHSKRKYVGDLAAVWKKVPVLGKPVHGTTLDAPVGENAVEFQPA
jgi:hypothetical protein